MAPEVYQRQAYSRSIDVFSWAITMSEILSGNQPYVDDVIDGQWEKIMPQICNNGKRPKLPSDLPKELLDIITTAWHSDGTKREAWFEDIVNGLKQFIPVNPKNLVWPDLTMTENNKQQQQQQQQSKKSEISRASPSPRSTKHRRASASSFNSSPSKSSTTKIKRSATHDALQTESEKAAANRTKRDFLTASGSSLGRRGNSGFPQENNKFVGEFLRFSWDVNDRSLYHKRK